MTEWMTPDELSKVTGKSLKRLAQYRADRVGPAFHKIPGTSIILYNRSDFDALLQNNRMATRDESKIFS